MYALGLGLRAASLRRRTMPLLGGLEPAFWLDLRSDSARRIAPEQSAPGNAVRNPHGTGGTAGTIGSGGVAPTNWAATIGSGSALAWQLVGAGTDASGWQYSDWRLSGMAANAATSTIAFEPPTQISVAPGETWTESVYAHIVAGSASGCSSMGLQVTERDSGGTSLLSGTATVAAFGSSRARYTLTRLVAHASATKLQPYLRITPTSGQAVDITIRVSVAQIERGSAATIPVATGPATELLTCTRAGSAWHENGQALVPAAADTQRRGARGLLIEDTATNQIVNSSGAGVVVGVLGSGGVLPTGWFHTALAGLTRTVVAAGTDADGWPYVDLRYHGTNTSGASATISMQWEPSGGAAYASTGQVYTASVYAHLVAGSTAGLTSPALAAVERTAAGTSVGSGTTALALTSSRQRITHTRTLTGATAERVVPRLQWVIADGASCDITVRISAPQVELGAMATSPILTTAGAATRNADVVTINSLAWLTPAAGTLFAVADTLGASAAGSIVGLGSGRLRQDADGTAKSDSGSVVIQATAGGGQLWSTRGKAALAWDGAGRSLVMGGGAVAADANGVGDLATLRLGSFGGASDQLDGLIEELAWWPTRGSDAHLQALTA